MAKSLAAQDQVDVFWTTTKFNQSNKFYTKKPEQ